MPFDVSSARANRCPGVFPVFLRNPPWVQICVVFDSSFSWTGCAAVQRRGVSNTGTFAALGTLYSLEKFMFLHLVAIVGVIYGEINASLQGLEDKESRTRFRQVSPGGRSG